MDELTVVADLIALLSKIKKDYDADCIKVYFESENNYCIKIIKNGSNIKTFRKKEGNTNFDAKKGKK